MEVAAEPHRRRSYSRYGSTTHKQVYIYGGLDTGPTELNRSFGMAWGDWRLACCFRSYRRSDRRLRKSLRDRVAQELKTTFASHYTAEISLAETLRPDVIAVYNRRATGEKYLINPTK